jgi:hypothetical protein
MLPLGTVGTLPAQIPNEPLPPPGHYGENTPDVTRRAHRDAVAALRDGDWASACDAVGVLPTSEKRSLTYYLELLCTVHHPELALTAGRIDFVLSSVSVPPGLRESEREAADRYFAWIAAIQDVLSDAVERRGFDRPMPPGLRGSRDLLLRVAWIERGKASDEATYDATRRSFEAALGTLEGELAESALLAGLTHWNADSILYADLSQMPLPELPAMSLPANQDL